MHVGTLEQFLDRVRARDPQQPEFHQAVREVMESVWPFVDAHPDYADDGLLDRIVEPQRAANPFKLPDHRRD